MGFDSKLVVEKLDDGKNWKIARGFIYTTRTGWQITIPCGFVTDFASIPRGLWNIFPPTGKYGHAAVVHDYLYRRTELERDECDRIFLEAMEDLKVGWFTRRLIYRAVRLFGGFARG
jgi:hypothetical protein